LRVAVQRVHHFATNGVDHFGLGSIQIFLILVPFAIQALFQAGSLIGYVGCFLVAERRLRV